MKQVALLLVCIEMAVREVKLLKVSDLVVIICTSNIQIGFSISMYCGEVRSSDISLKQETCYRYNLFECLFSIAI